MGRIGSSGNQGQDRRRAGYIKKLVIATWLILLQKDPFGWPSSNNLIWQRDPGAQSGGGRSNGSNFDVKNFINYMGYNYENSVYSLLRNAENCWQTNR